MNKYPAGRIAVVNFTGFRPNWGCQATSWGMIELLNKELDLESLPCLTLVPLIPRHKIDRRIEQDSLQDIHDAMLDVCHGGNAAGRSLDFLERLTFERYGKYAGQTRASDLVILQAEGTMAGTDFLRGARLLLLPFVAKHAWKKPVIAMNQTIYSCDDEFTRVMAAAYNSFDLVAVRENISFDAAQAAGISQVLHIPDAAFLTRPQKGMINLQPGRYFAITGTAWHGEDTHEQIFAAADRLKQETGLTPLITVSTQEDAKLLELARKHWDQGEYATIPSEVSYWAAAYATQQCRFVLSGRYHMSIMALAGGTPVIQLPGNTYKNEGLSAMLGGLAPVREFGDIDGIASDAAALLADPSETTTSLLAALAPINERIQVSAQYLAAVQKGQSPAIPDLLLNLPGKPISAERHATTYCANTVRQVAGFSYSEAQGAGLGQDPIPRVMFGPLLRAYRGGNQGMRNSLVQMLRSYPSKIEGAYPDFKAEIHQLPREFLSMAGVPCRPEPGEAIGNLHDLQRLCGDDVGKMITAIVPGIAPAPPRPRAGDLSIHMATLRDEFATKSELQFYHAALICLMRREIETAQAFACFNAIWTTEQEYLLRELDSRWLIAACDTYADHADDRVVRNVALTGSVLANVVKLYETENWATGRRGADEGYRAVTTEAKLYDGVSAFWIGSGDLILNLRNRLSAITKTDHVISRIVSELFSRLHRQETVFKRFREVQYVDFLRWDTEL